MPKDIGSEPGNPVRREAGAPEREAAGGRDRPLRGPDPLGAGISSTLLGRDPGEGRIADVRRSRGPKGFRRADDRILDELAEAIARSGVDASDVAVTVEGGVARLTGTVDHREDRRMLEDLAWGTRGVDDVDNAVRVRKVH